MEKIKNAPRQISAFLIPRKSAKIPVNAVNTTPPIPVDTVIMAVAVAFLAPEYDNIIVRTHG